MKRREFIKKSGVIAAGIVTAPAWFDMAGFSKTVSETQDLENLFNISAVEAEKLLRLALSRGAQSADLFFEYRPNSSLRIEDGIIKVR